MLPEELLVDILSERLKVCGVGEKETFLLWRDRHRGTTQRGGGGGLYMLLEDPGLCAGKLGEAVAALSCRA